MTSIMRKGDTQKGLKLRILFTMAVPSHAIGFEDKGQAIVCKTDLAKLNFLQQPFWLHNEVHCYTGNGYSVNKLVVCRT